MVSRSWEEWEVYVMATSMALIVTRCGVLGPRHGIVRLVVMAFG